jgi:hypothetical protein
VRHAASQGDAWRWLAAARGGYHHVRAARAPEVWQGRCAGACGVLPQRETSGWEGEILLVPAGPSFERSEMEQCWLTVEWNGRSTTSQFTNKKAAAEWLTATIQDFYLEYGIGSSSYIVIRGG